MNIYLLKSGKFSTKPEITDTKQMMPKVEVKQAEQKVGETK